MEGVQLSKINQLSLNEAILLMLQDTHQTLVS